MTAEPKTHTHTHTQRETDRQTDRQTERERHREKEVCCNVVKGKGHQMILFSKLIFALKTL